MLVITGYATVELSIQALRNGAFDILTKPFEPEELIHRVRNVLRHNELEEENRKLRQGLKGHEQFGDVVGRSPDLIQVLDTARKIAGRDIPVTITGESGTGKDVLARAIHGAGPRSSDPFVAINCAAFPETLLDNELFGHEKGAFTGAVKDKPGRFQAANGGTILLGEIGDISPRMQMKLLRVLQEKEFERVGETTPRKVDVRVIAATNRNLKELVADGAFREDLFYRLNVVQISMPTLRERKEDIALLAEHFLGIFKKESGFKELTFSEAALKKIVDSDWPGNIRELRNAIERAVVMGNGQVILPKDLPVAGIKRGRQSLRAGTPLKEAMNQFKKEFISFNLKQAGGNRSKAAKLLNIQRTYLSRLISQYGIKD